MHFVHSRNILEAWAKFFYDSDIYKLDDKKRAENILVQCILHWRYDNDDDKVLKKKWDWCNYTKYSDNENFEILSNAHNRAFVGEFFDYTLNTLTYIKLGQLFK